MSDKVYVGQRAVSADSSPSFDAYSKVVIIAGENDDGTPLTYEAGDDTGRTLEVNNPLIYSESEETGNQIAADMLARIKGYAYQPFTASGALLDPAAELGDGVTVDGIYSVLAAQDIRFGPIMSSDISAPSGGEIESEYPYTSKAAREIKREAAKTRAELIVSYDSIVARVTTVETTYATKIYANTQASAAETSAKSYADTQAGSAESNAKSYADDTFATKVETITSVSLSMDTTNGIVLEYEQNGQTLTTSQSMSSFVTSSSITANASGVAVQYTKYGGSATISSRITVSNSISIESGTVSIGSNRLTVTSDNFKVSGSGDVTAVGTFTTDNGYYRSQLSAGALKFSYNGSSRGSIIANQGLYKYGTWGGPYYGTEIRTDASATVFSIPDSTSESGYVYNVAFDNGLHPWGYSESFQVLEDARVHGYFAANYLEIGASSNTTGHVNVYAYFNADGSGGLWCRGGLDVDGDFYVGGTKNRIVETPDYGSVCLGAMESASPVFSDFGSGVTGADGETYIYFDPVFLETVDVSCEYQVFVTQTGEGSIRRVEKHEDYFIVYGDSAAAFDWIVYARQRDYTMNRLETAIPGERREKDTDDSLFRGDDIGAHQSKLLMDELETDYDSLADQYMNHYESEVSGE